VDPHKLNHEARSADEIAMTSQLLRALRTAAIALAVTALLPAGAAAAAPTATSVAKKVQKAHGRTAKAVKLVRAGHPAGDDAVKAARRHVTSAARDARKLATLARTERQRLAAAGATALVAGRLGEDARAYAQAVDDASGASQAAVASAVPGTIASLDSMIDLLEQISGKLTAQDRATVQEAIAALLTKLPPALGDIAGAIQAPGVSTSLAGVLQSALGAATAALQEALATVQTTIATLSPDVQGLIAKVLDVVDVQLSGVAGLALEISGAVAGAVEQCLALVQQIVGGIFGGDPPPAGTGSGLLGGLLPGFGGLFDKLLSLPAAILGR
jgi:hypothetical protein